METIRSVIGLGSSKPEEGKEPINGETGAGTAVAPYDAGNQEENPLPTTTASGKEPINGVTGEGTALEPYDAGNKEEVDALAAAPAETAVAEPLVLTEPKEGTAPTTVNGEADKAETTAEPAGSAATSAPEAQKSTTAEAAPAATAVPTAETTPAAGPAAVEEKKEAVEESKPADAKIGGSSWFKNTLQRRKSKTPAATDSKDEEKAVEKEEAKKDTVVAAPVVVAEKSAPPKTEKAAKPAPEKKAAQPAPEKKAKKERSLSKDFKSFFKRNSKAGLEEKEAKQEKSAVPVAAGAAAGAGTAVVAGEAIKEEREETVPPTAVEEPASAAPVENAKGEPIAANVLPSEVPAGVAEPAAESELPPLTDAKTLEEPEPVKVEEPIAVAPEVPAEDNAPASYTADDDLAPDEIAPGQRAETATVVPAINEPQADKASASEPARTASRNPAGENLSAIPTAGGIRLGESAYTRRTSIAPPSPSVNGAAKALPEPQAGPSKTTETAVAGKAPAEKSDDTLKRRQSVLGKLKEKLKI